MSDSDNSPLPKNVKDLTGRLFGRLTALEFVCIKNHEAHWRCICACNKQIIVSGHSLRRGNTKSCGCYNHDVHSALARKLFRKDLTGQRFARLTVIRFSHVHHHPSGKSHLAMWRCKCACGKEIVTSGQVLRRGTTKSCGCLVIETSSKLNLQHGFARTRQRNYLYELWAGIKDRCFNPNDRGYPRYGGRGIRMEEEWRNDFKAFVTYILSTLGHRPTQQHSLDRLNNEGHYEPGNIGWRTPAEQSRNTRRTRFITAGGRTQCLTDWANELGRNPGTIAARLDFLGWTPDEACEIVQRTKPILQARRHLGCES